jgi:hypothetical protein
MVAFMGDAFGPRGDAMENTGRSDLALADVVHGGQGTGR